MTGVQTCALPIFDLFPSHDSAEVFNEINGAWIEQADLYISILPQFAADGLRLCAFNCASGTPQYPHIDPLPYRQIKRVCDFALWTMGGWVNIEASFAELADYLATVAPVEPVPTDREFDHWLDLDTGARFTANPYSFAMPARNVRL